MNDEDIDVIHWNAGLWDCLRLIQFVLDNQNGVDMEKAKEADER